MICPNCNNNLIDGTTVCPFCGASVQPQQPPVQQPVQQSGEYYTPPVQPQDQFQQQGQYYNPPVQPQNSYQQGNPYQQPPQYNPNDPQAQQQYMLAQLEEKAKKSKTLGIVAIVFALFIPLVSWICGGIGLSNANKMLAVAPTHQIAKSGKTLCTVGIVLGVVSWILAVLITTVGI